MNSTRTEQELGRLALLEDRAIKLRMHFPALNTSQTAFLDNAGGSQLPGVVIEAMTQYLRESYVQLGADYAVSKRATAVVAGAHRYLKTFMGALDSRGRSNSEPIGEVILGASTSQLIYTLAHAHARILAPGDEIIISEASHESNVGAWVNLGTADGPRPGVIVKFWPVDPRTGQHSLAALESLISPRTRLVCFPHVSNILGEIVDVAGITQLVHRASNNTARVLVDGVAYAPHRAIDVAAWNVDWYVYSTYKVFGPHMAAMFGTHSALAPLTGPNHFFVPKDELPRKFELGGVSHEGAAVILALDHYLRDLIGVARLHDPADPHAAHDRSVVTRAFEVIESIETPLQTRLIEYLRTKPGVRIVGPEQTDPTKRLCIVSFTRSGKSSKDIVQAANAQGLGFRFGTFYAYRLCQALGIDASDGVVRVSFAHYNTHAELDRVVAYFDQAL